MSTKRLGLLMVGHVPERSQRLGGDYPELFAALLRAHPIEIVRFDVDRGGLPSSLGDCDGWLVSPSRSSVYDDQPWIEPATDLVRDVLAAERPFVGICFGHQLVARALGAPVERFPGGWQVGVHEYEVTVRPPWMEPAPTRLRLVASHQDQATAVPAGTQLLARATTGECSIAGLAVHDRAWTLQPHPEFSTELSGDLIASRSAVIGEERAAAARATLDTPLDQPVVAAWIARTIGAA